MVLLQDQVHLEQTSTEQIRVPERTMVLESSVPTSSNPNPFLCMKFQRIDIATLLSLSSLLVGIKAACTETSLHGNGLWSQYVQGHTLSTELHTPSTHLIQMRPSSFSPGSKRLEGSSSVSPGPAIPASAFS